MAKCKQCGKRGFFLKLNEHGICSDCVRINHLKEQETNLSLNIQKLDGTYSALNKEFEYLKSNKEAYYEELLKAAKMNAIKEVQDQIELKHQEINALQSNKNILLSEITSLQEDMKSSQKTLTSNANKLQKSKELFKSLQYSTKRYYELMEFNKDIFDEADIKEAEELLSTTIQLKLHHMDVRELRKRFNQNNKLIQEILAKYQERYTTKANLTIYRLMVIALEAELQNILFNLNFSKLDKAIDSVKELTAKYQKIAADGNQSIANTIIRFIGEIEFLYIEAVKIEYEYFIQKERIKEEQRTLREQMRQEAAERKILEEQRKKIEAEETKYEQEIDNIQQLMKETEDNEKIRQLEERLAKIQQQLDDVEKKKEEIHTLQNGKAGYIYIISNLGSFGEKMFKVGMTRRLNPQDRVDELGDASVPFKFDVHSFIFSDNAPDLEYKLHKHLNDQRVNKVNLRKEFFYCTIDELEELVYSLEPTAQFNRTMLAEQYYQSMAITEVPDEFEVVYDVEEIDEEEEAV